MSNGFIWFDVNAKPEDVAAVTTFYQAVLDGPIGPNPDQDAESPYRSWMIDGETPWAAVVEADDATTGQWVPYIHVPDIEKATKAAVKAGGTVVLPKTAGPAGPAGHAVTVADPAGALVALWVPFET